MGNSHKLRLLIKTIRITYIPWLEADFYMFSKYNVTVRRVRITVVLENQYYYVFSVRLCVCSLSYLACKAHSPYYVIICVLSACSIFFKFHK